MGVITLKIFFGGITALMDPVLARDGEMVAGFGEVSVTCGMSWVVVVVFDITVGVAVLISGTLNLCDFCLIFLVEVPARGRGDNLDEAGD
jgi:hypothetical protein